MISMNGQKQTYPIVIIGAEPVVCSTDLGGSCGVPARDGEVASASCRIPALVQVLPVGTRRAQESCCGA